MTHVIIYAIMPIFVIILLGFWAGKAKMVDNRNVSLLNVFVMNFALPASLFGATVKTPWQSIVEQAPLIVVLVLTMWITYAASYFIYIKYCRKTAQDTAVLTLTVALPNYAALALPILGSVLGDKPSIYLTAAISIACGSVLLSPLTLLVLEQEKAKADGTLHSSTLTMFPRLIWQAVQKPIVWGPLLGVILSAFSIPVPDIVLASIKPLGLSATATALFLTGLILSSHKLQINRVVILSSLTKLVVQPLIAWIIVLAIGLHGELAISAILLTTLAAGFFGIVFGNNFGVESPDAEATLLLTSILCIVTLPVFITLTTGM